MYFNSDTVLYLDGKWVKAREANTDLYGQTLHYGHGVFDGLRAYKTPSGTQIFKANEHFERFLKSADSLQIMPRYSVEKLVDVAYDLLEKNNLENAYIRPLVFMGARMSLLPADQIHLMITAWEWGRYLGNQSIDVIISSYRRPHPQSVSIQAKVVGQYTNFILASQEARKKGYDEALLLDVNGFVAQGPGTNFFYEKDEILYTPPKTHVVAGITRDTVIKFARELGLEVVEKYFKPEDLWEADSAFFTGTAAEIVGIKSVNKQPFKMSWQDSLGHVLHVMYRRRVTHQDITDFNLV